VSELKVSLTQRPGFAHRMRQAIVASGAYMPEMRRIFEERGLPIELTVLPFIESAFSLKAYSSASAAGLWQFIPATGRAYLRIDQYVDERYDPILATYAAASHLASEFKFFNDWPLTINGYNTGPGRMQQAVRELKTTNIAAISKYFRGSGYGFDSRNYYPEFLAALEIYNNRETYFGDIAEVSPEPYDYLTMLTDTNLKQLFRSAGISESLMATLNPGLKPEVIAGLKDLPKGYLLKVPPERKDDVLLAAQEIHQEQQYASYHVVTKGEKLNEIALQYGVDPLDLAKTNGLIANKKLKAGDVLRLPALEGSATNFSIVRPGEEKIDIE
jgi:membrane-bound lytic murein transglycosylase D